MTIYHPMNINGYLKRLSIIDRLNNRYDKKLNVVTDAITEEQRQAILDQGRKEGKGGFFKANRKYFRYPGCQCHIDYELPPKYDDL